MISLPALQTVLFLQQDSHVGGAEISLANLLNALDKTRYKPVLVLPDDDMRWDLFAIPGVAIWTIRIEYLKRVLSPSTLVAYLRAFTQAIVNLRRNMRKTRNSISIVHSGSMSAQLHAVALRCYEDISVVWHVRDIVPQDCFGKAIVRLCASGSDTIIAISEAVRLSLLNAGVSACKCQVVYNGVNIDSFRGDTISRQRFRQELGLARDTPLIVHIGKVIPAKGQDIFIKAMPGVISRFPEAYFVIIGGAVPGWEGFAAELERLRLQFGLVDHLSILEFRQDIREVIAAADIIVNSSRMEEPFGRTIIEAMALEKPVIGPNHGGVPEIIVNGVTGLLFTPDCHQDLARSLLELLSDFSKMREMGSTGRERVEQFFSLEAHTRQIQLIYDEMTKKAQHNND